MEWFLSMVLLSILVAIGNIIHIHSKECSDFNFQKMKLKNQYERLLKKQVKNGEKEQVSDAFMRRFKDQNAILNTLMFNLSYEIFEKISKVN